MEAINERFVQLRKACKKNQTEWGLALGISRSGVAAIEAGQRAVTEKHLLLLSNWAEYHINIDWLRTGEGSMFLETETDALEAIRQEYGLSDLQFSFVSKFLRLPADEKQVIFNFLESVFSDISTGSSEQDRIDAEVASYRQELELEARAAGDLSASGTGDVKEA